MYVIYIICYIICYMCHVTTSSLPCTRSNYLAIWQNGGTCDTYLYDQVYLYHTIICTIKCHEAKSSIGDCSGRVQITLAANFLYHL